MNKRHRLDLNAEEHARLLTLTRQGRAAARKIHRAQALLLAAEGRSDDAIAAALHIGRATVARTRKRFVEEGLEASLCDRPRPGETPKLDGKQEA
jgi:transposase